MSVARTHAGRTPAAAGQQDGDVATLERDIPGVPDASRVPGYVGPLRASSGHTAAPKPRHIGRSIGGRLAAWRGPAAAGSSRSGIGALRAFANPVPTAAATAPSEHDDILDTVHAPTVKVIKQLRHARHQLQRAALPELRLMPAIRALLRTEQRLARPLRVAICGEVNAGKSSLANLLAGIESLPTAVTINTLIPTLLYYASEPEIWAVRPGGQRERLLRSNRSLPRESAHRIEVGLPSPRLAAVQVLDLPGFSGARTGIPVVDLSAHQVDATIWCTVCTQAWKESERSAWSMLSARLSARSLLVATHSDLLLRPEDRQSLMARLSQEVGTSFSGIIPLATLDALAVMGDDRKGTAAWVTSGARALESALADLLVRVREQRAAAAHAVTSRIAQRALKRIESLFGA